MKTPAQWITDKLDGFGFSFVDDIQPQCRTLCADSGLERMIERIQNDAIESYKRNAETKK